MTLVPTASSAAHEVRMPATIASTDDRPCASNATPPPWLITTYAGRSATSLASSALFHCVRDGYGLGGAPRRLVADAKAQAPFAAMDSFQLFCCASDSNAGNHSSILESPTSTISVDDFGLPYVHHLTSAETSSWKQPSGVVTGTSLPARNGSGVMKLARSETALLAPALGDAAIAAAPAANRASPPAAV